MTIAATTIEQGTGKGRRVLPIRRICLTLLITGVIAISATATQAQPTSRRAWPRGASSNPLIPANSNQAIESVPVVEPRVTPQDSKKTAIVGSWLLTLEIGNKVVASYTSDGVAIGSSQGDVSLAPDFPTSTSQHGAWKYMGGQQFGITLASVLYDVPTAESRGLIKIHLLVTVNNQADQFNGTANVDIFDTDGNPVATFSFGVQGTRINVDSSN
jgi:hypothetical protein